MLVHFYVEHGRHNRGQATTEAILNLGPDAYPGALFTPGMPARPQNVPDDAWNNYLAQQGASIARGEGCVYVFESVGRSTTKIKTYNYGLCLIGPDNRVRPEEEQLLNDHAAGNFRAGDIDLMILKRNHHKFPNLETAFKASVKVNGGKPYQVFH